jgi:hypothetical protein
MWRFVFIKWAHRGSGTADAREAGSDSLPERSTHFEQLTMPSGKEWLPKSWRDLLGLEPFRR